MRTTVTFDQDTTSAIEQIRRERGIGVSAAVNELIRRGLGRAPRQRPFVQRTSSGHARVDVTNVGEVLGWLDEPVAD